MKTILIALAIGLLGSDSFAQTTQVKIGRHGACSSGRGICGIQYQPTAKASSNNAEFIKDEQGSLILRLYKNSLSDAQVEMLFGKIILDNSNLEQLLIEQAFDLDANTKSAIHDVTGTFFNTVKQGSFEVLINDHFIDVILLKSKS